MDKIRFALIGGGMAGPLSANAIKNIDNAEIIAFCDVNEAVCQQYKKEYQIPYIYTDYKEMLKNDEIDVVCVITPPFLHEQMVTDIAKSKKHIICEKPIATNLIEADNMIAVCEKEGITLGVIFMYRFMKQALIIKDALDSGKIGRLLSVDCIGKSFRSDEYYASGKWRGTWSGEGGGSLISQTVHFIDLMLFIAGDVESLSGDYMTTIHDDIEVDDMANAIFKFKNGAIGSVVSSTAIRPGYPRRLEIHGEKGTIILEEEKIIQWKIEGMNEDDYLTKEIIDSGDTATKAGYVNYELHKLQIEDFIEAIRNNRKPKIDGQEGRRALEFIRAIYISGMTGKKVQFPVEDDGKTYKKNLS